MILILITKIIIAKLDIIDNNIAELQSKIEKKLN